MKYFIKNSHVISGQKISRNFKALPGIQVITSKALSPKDAKNNK